MLSLSQIKVGKIILVDDQPHLVLSNQHSKMGRAGAVMRTKLKNLTNGAMFDKTFQGADKLEEAELDKSTAQFLYAEGDLLHFMDMGSYEQLSLPREILGNAMNYLLEGTEVSIVSFDNTPINVELPIKVTLTVTDAPPGIKGDTASGGDKLVTVETGAQITTPLFINTDDKIIVNTETGQYSGRE